MISTKKRFYPLNEKHQSQPDLSLTKQTLGRPQKYQCDLGNTKKQVFSTLNDTISACNDSTNLDIKTTL